MAERRTLQRAARDRRMGKSPSTQAGEFVREEMEHIRKGKHGARSTKQAIAIGLSKARRAGVKLPPPKPGSTSEATRRHAKRALESGQDQHAVSRKRSRAISSVLKRETRRAASRKSLAAQARSAARRRTAGKRSAAAEQSVSTKGLAARSAAARKAARTRARRRRS